MEDGGEVLRNLPRSRPGTRSGKRAGGERPGAATERAAVDAERRGAASARSPSTEAGSSEAGPEEASALGDPLWGAIRFAARSAMASAEVAGAVSREIRRRLPRP